MRAELGHVPESYVDAYASLQLLWEQGVGTHSRAKEREQTAAEAKKAAAYQESVARLKRQQE